MICGATILTQINGQPLVVTRTRVRPFQPILGLFKLHRQLICHREEAGIRLVLMKNDRCCTYLVGVGLISVLKYISLINVVTMSDVWKYDIRNRMWTWIGGHNTTSTLTTYGTFGVESPLNRLGFRHSSQYFFHSPSSSLVVIGGQSPSILGDIWRFNFTSEQWTWVDGSIAWNFWSKPGTKNVEAASNVMGSRYGGFAFVDPENMKIYVYGGYGYATLSSGVGI
jgi:hypothetical protein